MMSSHSRRDSKKARDVSKALWLICIVLLLAGCGSAASAPASDIPSAQPTIASEDKGSDQATGGNSQSKSNTGKAKRKAAAPSRANKRVAVYYSVVEVVDGDTIKIAKDGRTETLRLIGLDTPETKDPRRPVQCFGEEASARAKKLLSGKKVRITQDTRDKYGRMLVYVWTEDGMLYNHRMILDGYAHEYTYDVPYQQQARFRKAEAQARQAGRGFWSPKTCGGDTKQPAEEGTESQPSKPPRQQAPPAGADDGVDKDCSDFDTRREAQRYFESQGGSATNDVDKLDGNGNGKACESLP